ncbi:MAG: type II secretion system protein GspM [Proteobacteria bacterium]|nr:type II secretion system protein GspM [Pseudomonadota bacterium]
MTDSRHLVQAWTVLFGIVSLFAVGLWIPLNDSRVATQERISALDQRLSEYRALKQSQAKIERALAALKGDAALNQWDRFVVAKSVALGAAELQRTIKDIIETNGGRQTSSQSLLGEKSDDFHNLLLNVSFSGDLPAIQRILMAFERNETRLFIDHVSINANSAQRHGRSLNTRSNQGPATLIVRIGVSAYMHKRETNDV